LQTAQVASSRSLYTNSISPTINKNNLPSLYRSNRSKIQIDSGNLQFSSAEKLSARDLTEQLKNSVPYKAEISAQLRKTSDSMMKQVLDSHRTNEIKDYNLQKAENLKE
jgi:hypothetical protein